MTEAEIVRKIKILKEIKPREDWVILTKKQILGDYETRPRSLFSQVLEVLRVLNYKPAFATVVVLLILVGAFGFAQKSLPGDLLYPLKKITEKSRVVFVLEEDQPKVQLQLANRRLEDLTKIAEANRIKNLAPAISAFQASVSQAAEKITEAKKPDVKEIVKQTKKLEENKQKVEALGVVIGETEELDNALAQLVEREIEELESQSLTETQQKVLEEAKEDYEGGNYTEALIKILNLSQ